MNFTERCAKINTVARERAERDEAIRKAKEAKMAEARRKAEKILERVGEMLALKHLCEKNGIKIPGEFAADSMYHRIGFMSKYDSIGYYAGGYCGDNDFYCDGNDFFYMSHQNDFSDKNMKVDIKDYEKLVKDFDNFECNFYAWLDNLH